MNCHSCKKPIGDINQIVFCKDCMGHERQRQRAIFRREVYKKHGMVCKHCGITDKRVLTIDHIDPEGDRYDIKNTQVLCNNCHRIKEIEYNAKR